MNSKSRFKRSVAKKRQRDNQRRYNTNEYQSEKPERPRETNNFNSKASDSKVEEFGDNNTNPYSQKFVKKDKNTLKAMKQDDKSRQNDEFGMFILQIPVLTSFDSTNTFTEVAQPKRRDIKEKAKRPGSKKYEDLSKMDFSSKEEQKVEPAVRDIISADDFNSLNIDPKLKQVLEQNGYRQLTNIQKASIPVILSSNNVLVKSETGSGKTLCYCVPLIDHLVKFAKDVERITRDHGTYAIIFSPTRELCLQIENTLKKILKPFNYIVPGCLMGGEQVKKEKARLRKGINILICTPGRLLYHLNNTQSLKLDRLQYLIFDESDRILDMGFEREMTQCLQGLKLKASNLFVQNQEPNNFLTNHKVKVNLVSATLGKKVNNLSNKLMKNEIRVGFDTKNDEKPSNDEENIIDLRSSIPSSIQQHYMKVPNHKFKLLYLLSFLNLHQNSKLIVFMSTCDCVNYLSELLRNINWINLLRNRSDADEDKPDSTAKIFDGKIFCLHGKMKHTERKIAFSQFDKLTEGILISTDVASRGLDFKNVDWVVQFDVHPSLKEYANRIGRTARLNVDNVSTEIAQPSSAAGNSLIFIDEGSETPYIDCLVNYGAKITEMNRFKLLQEFTKFAQEKYHKSGRGTRVFTQNEVEIEDEKFEILLFLKLLVRDTNSKNPALGKTLLLIFKILISKI